jgi:ribosome-associated heat shock protein Hsp15
MAEVRLDKWLQVARAFKTRSQATRACTLSRVRVNGEIAKPHRRLQIGDRVEFGSQAPGTPELWNRVWVVQELRDKPLPKADVPRLYEDQSPPPPEPDPAARLLRRTPVLRERGAGRPTKKERRDMDRLRGS